MELAKQFEVTGQYLFRHRGTIPAGTLLLFMLALNGHSDPIQYEGLESAWEVGLVLFSLVGLAIRVATVGSVPPGTSGRNTQQQVADALNTTGIYSIVRHPLYIGNFFIFLGISLFPQNPWVVAICVLLFWLFYCPIMMAEERYLRQKFDATFLEWTRRTPAIVPRFWLWRKSERRFSLRKAIRREYQTPYAIVVYYTLLEITEDYFREGLMMPDRKVWILLLVSTALYLALIAVTKRTRWLENAPPPEPEADPGPARGAG